MEGLKNPMVQWYKSGLLLRCAKKYLWWLIRAVIIFGLCFIILYPLTARLLNVLMTLDDLTDPTIRLYPKHFSLDFFRTAINKMHFLSAFARTLAISLSSALLQVLVCASAGYGFARHNFKGKTLLFVLMLLILAVPPQVYSGAMFLNFRYFGLKGIATVNLIDTVWPYFLLSLTGMGFKNGLYIFVMRQQFRGMPVEFEEAAFIDGYSSLKTFWFIMLPNCRNMLLTLFVLAFSWSWTDNLYSTLFSRNFQTLAVAVIQNIRQTSPTSGQIGALEFSALRNAGSLLIIAPLLILFIVVQKQLVESLERSGLVG